MASPAKDKGQDLNRSRVIAGLVVWDATSERFAKSERVRVPARSILPCSRPGLVSVSVKKTLLLKIILLARYAFRAPTQWLESSFCCRIAGQRLTQEECLFHRHRYQSRPFEGPREQHGRQSPPGHGAPVRPGGHCFDLFDALALSCNFYAPVCGARTARQTWHPWSC